MTKSLFINSYERCCHVINGDYLERLFGSLLLLPVVFSFWWRDLYDKGSYIYFINMGVDICLLCDYELYIFHIQCNQWILYSCYLSSRNF